MSMYAVIDTNVIIAALLSKKSDTATVKIIKAIADGRIVPLVHETILAEYEDVLHREKFHLHENTVQTVLQAIRYYGKMTQAKPTAEVFVDTDDLIFYEVAIAQKEHNAYLVTGNQRHYPSSDFIVTPAQMMEILEKQDLS